MDKNRNHSLNPFQKLKRTTHFKKINLKIKEVNHFKTVNNRKDDVNRLNDYTKKVKVIADFNDLIEVEVPTLNIVYPELKKDKKTNIREILVF